MLDDQWVFHYNKTKKVGAIKMSFAGSNVEFDDYYANGK